MARDVARTAAGVAPALAAVQEPSSRTTAACARTVSEVQANAAAAAPGAAPAMAPNDARTAPPGHAARRDRRPSQFSLARGFDRLNQLSDRRLRVAVQHAGLIEPE